MGSDCEGASFTALLRRWVRSVAVVSSTPGATVGHSAGAWLPLCKDFSDSSVAKGSKDEAGVIVSNPNERGDQDDGRRHGEMH